MGIKNGAQEFIKAIQFGIYNRHATVYDINVDGENLQYKGYVESNLFQANAEAAIAATAHEYLATTIRSIELYLGEKPRKVNIYMDGERVKNKETRANHTYDFDRRQIRTFFMHHCMKSNWTILQSGESELHMYLSRDKSVNLNVFISNDSDMISICYGHEPICRTDILNIETQDFSTANDDITDFNRVYARQSTDEQDAADGAVKKPVQNTAEFVHDSCLWVNTNKQALTFVGFDYIADKLQYSPQIFRVMIALCGTDFTTGVLTNTQIKSLLSLGHENINQYTEAIGMSTPTAVINKIVVALLVLSFREGGVVNRTTYEATDEFDVEKFADSIRIYCEYVNTGQMLGNVVHQNCGLVVQHYLYAMQNQMSGIKGKALKTWARNIGIDEAIINCTHYLGTFDPKPAVLERKQKQINRRMQQQKHHYNNLTDASYGQISGVEEFKQRPSTSQSQVEEPPKEAKALDMSSFLYKSVLDSIYHE